MPSGAKSADGCEGLGFGFIAFVGRGGGKCINSHRLESLQVACDSYALANFRTTFHRTATAENQSECQSIVVMACSTAVRGAHVGQLSGSNINPSNMHDP